MFRDADRDAGVARDRAGARSGDGKASAGGKSIGGGEHLDVAAGPSACSLVKVLDQPIGGCRPGRGSPGPCCNAELDGGLKAAAVDRP